MYLLHHGMFYHGDTIALTLFNLIDNSVKYAVNSEIFIRLGVENNTLKLDYFDSGPGMSSELIDRFNQFKDDGIRSTEENGASIGWFIIAECVSMLDGSFDILDTKGKGFSVVFKFPYVS